MLGSDLVGLSLFFLLLFAIIGLAELIRRMMGWTPEATRKSVHMATGLLVATTPFVLQSKWPMVILGSLFVIVNSVAIHKQLFKAMHATTRCSYGTVFYPLSFVILVLWLWDGNRIALVTAMLIMALADALAAIVGENVRKPMLFSFGTEMKSVQGSVTMFGATAVIVFVFLSLFPFEGAAWIEGAARIWIALLVAVFSTACEAISTRGSDNLSVPLGAAFILTYVHAHSAHDARIFTLGMVLALAVALGSYRIAFLDAGGAAFTFILGTLIFGVGRIGFTLPILAFYLLSSLLSLSGRRAKKRAFSLIEKGGRRDIWQVLANGGVPGLLLLLWYFNPGELFFLLYLGAVAAVTADTWGTEIGLLSRPDPRSILSLRRVPPGTSGGISLLGLAGSLLGSFVLISVGALVSPHAVGPHLFVLMVFAGFAAGLADSLFGATIQAQFRCPVCAKMTEKTTHCQGARSTFVRGVRWINNDVVNFFCALCGTLFVYAGLVFLNSI